MSSSTESSKKWASPRWEVAVARTGRVHQATDAVGSVSRAPGRPIHSLTTTIAPRLTLAMKPHCRADSTDTPPTPRTVAAVAARPGLPPSTAQSARHSVCLIGFKLEETCLTMHPRQPRRPQDLQGSICLQDPKRNPVAGEPAPCLHQEHLDLHLRHRV